MPWFLDLTTRNKLFIGLGLLLLFLAAIIVIASLNIVALRDAQQRLYIEDFVTAVTLKDIRSNQNGVRANLLAMLVVDDPTQHERLQKDDELRAGEIDQAIRQLVERMQNDPATLARLQELQRLQNDFYSTRDSELVPLIVSGEYEEAAQIAVGLQTERSSEMRVIVNELVAQADENALAFLSMSEERANNALGLFLLIGLVAFVAGIGISITLDRTIAAPLKMLSRVAGHVADGDLTVDLASTKRVDEVGALLDTFKHMVGTLREVNIQIREGTHVLGASASELVATTSQVAAGATQTASAISETTTTTEEVKQTAQVASQKARQVSDNAQRAAQVSQSGRQSIDATIQRMGGIREQMQIIGESILRLSQQNHTIGKITATVDDLAEQSNLLAVNAAIEAAKAGEHGKGFAVVAQEIRNLAEQSKQATTQVEAILHEIQIAINSAVTATEQGSKTVEAGLQQATESGETIHMLTNSIDAAAQAATQIAASSQQQLVGMDQVSQAMEDIKRASSQTAASTKQVETIAQNLHELGQQLQHLVEHYRL